MEKVIIFLIGVIIGGLSTFFLLSYLVNKVNNLMSDAIKSMDEIVQDYRDENNRAIINQIHNKANSDGRVTKNSSLE